MAGRAAVDPCGNGATSSNETRGVRMAEAAVPKTWNVGDVILDLYEVKRFNEQAGMDFAEGGQCRVYRVRHRTWNVDLAVKSPKPRVFRTEEEKQTFVNNCRTCIDLGAHPHIVSCHGVFVHEGVPHILAEFVEGGSLKDWIADGKTGELKTALDIAIQIARGMAFAHSRDVVHLNLKPRTVLLTQEGMAKVSDVGIDCHYLAEYRTEETAATGRTLVSKAAGTLGYAPPEQWSRGGPLDCRADVFSFGVTLWHMLGGRIAWADDHCKCAIARHVVNAMMKRSEPSSLPPALGEFILRCLHPEPENRWPGFGEFSQRLEEIYENETGEAYARPEP
jgi:serine/threonine protein kinase